VAPRYDIANKRTYQDQYGEVSWMWPDLTYSVQSNAVSLEDARLVPANLNNGQAVEEAQSDEAVEQESAALEH
jgi:hypothetical protein